MPAAPGDSLAAPVDSATAPEDFVTAAVSSVASAAAPSATPAAASFATPAATPATASTAASAPSATPGAAEDLTRRNPRKIYEDNYVIDKGVDNLKLPAVVSNPSFAIFPTSCFVGGLLDLLCPLSSPLSKMSKLTGVLNNQRSS